MSFCSRPIKARSDTCPQTLPRVWVINRAIILELRFKEVPKTGWADALTEGYKTKLKLTSCCIQLEPFGCQERSVPPILFFTWSEGVKETFDRIWRVLKHRMKYLCILLLFPQHRGGVLLQLELMHLCGVFQTLLNRILRCKKRKLVFISYS